MFERYLSAFGRKMTASLVVLPRTRWKKGESIKTGWRASRTTVLEVTDLKRLGALIAELSSSGAATIQGPSWQLDPSNDVHQRARRAAVADARRRAEAYMAELGLKLRRVAWLSEPGLRPLAGGVRASRASVVAEEPIEVAPDEITVRAVVEMAVEPSSPTLRARRTGDSRAVRDEASRLG